jgi:hypothetical protein
MILASRLMLHDGVFRFHSLVQLEQAPNYEVDVINYRKDGVLFSPVTIDVQQDFTDITKLAGWSSTYLPGIRQVTMETLGGFIAAAGRVQYLPPFNQITMVGDGGANDLDGTFYNTTGSAQPFSLNGAGQFMVLRHNENALLDIWVQAAFDPFQLNATDLEDECIRLKITVLLYQLDMFGGADKFASNTAGFSNVETQPIFGEGGEQIECASVTHSPISYSTNSSARLVRYSEPIHCGGNNARTFSQRIQFPLPPIDAAATGAYDFASPKIGGMLEVVKHDGQSLSGADQTTVDNAWIVGHFVAPTMYSSHNAADLSTDADKTVWTAAQDNTDFRESLELGTTSFGAGANSPATLRTVNGGTVLDWTSPGNVDGTDWIAQLVVKDVLRLRSKPREIFRGTGLCTNTQNFAFHKIYTINTIRYALLGCRLDGATNFSEVTFFQLNHDGSTTVTEDFEDGVLIGSRIKAGKGEVDSTSVASNNQEYLSALAFQQTSDDVSFVRQNMVPPAERQRARERLLSNGITVARADKGITTTPGFSLFTANANATDISRDEIQLIASTNVSFTEYITLPPLPVTTGKYLLQSIVGSTGQEFDPGILIAGNVGDVLQLASRGGSIVAEFGAASGGGGGGSGSGGFYTVQGFAKPGRTVAKIYFNLTGNSSLNSRQHDAMNTFAVPEAGTVEDFAIYSHGFTGSSATLALYKNGSTTATETESVTLTADGVDTGTFSTSVAAGDRLQFALTPLANSTNYSLTVKISI